MKNLILLSTALLLSLVMLGQEKNVHLIHGNNGDGDSWSSLETLFNTNCSDVVTAHTYDFNAESAQGLETYSSSLREAIGDENIQASTNDIAICHSFGGGAIRKMEHNSFETLSDINASSLFGGYMTVGSPHAGAQLANSVMNETDPTKPSFKHYLVGGCDEVIEDVTDAIADLIGSNPLQFFFPFVERLVDDDDALDMLLCDCAWDLLMTLDAVSSFAGPETVTDLAVGGAMSQLPAPIKPSISIRSTVEYPVHWNLIEQLEGDDGPANISGTYDLDNFTCFADASVVQNIVGGAAAFIGISVINKVINKFKETFLFFLPASPEKSFPEKMASAERWMYVASDLYHIGAWFHPFRVRRYRHMAIQLEQAAEWIDYSESGYTQLIGAGGGSTVSTYTEPEWVYICNCWCDEPIPCDDWQLAEELGCDGMLPPVPDYCSQSSEDFCWEKQDVEHTLVTPNPRMPSDGVVPLAAQELPGALRDEEVRNASVSHFFQTKSPDVRMVIQEQIKPATSANFVFDINDCNF